MSAEEFEKMCIGVVEEIKAISPIDTGNLRHNAIRFEMIDSKTFRIYVDEEIAPYMPFTNEPWLSPRWHGKQNPNELWWDEKAVNTVIDGIRRRLGERIVSERDEKGRKW